MSASLAKNRIYELFPDRALVNLKAGAASVGWAEKTARNMLVNGTFPIKTVLVGRKRLIVVADLARYYAELIGLDGLETQPGPTPTGANRQRHDGTSVAAREIGVRKHLEACRIIEEGSAK